MLTKKKENKSGEYDVQNVIKQLTGAQHVCEKC